MVVKLQTRFSACTEHLLLEGSMQAGIDGIIFLGQNVQNFFTANENVTCFYNIARLQQIQVRYQSVIADLASMVVQLKNILCNNSNQKHFLHASGNKKCKEFIVENESNEDIRNGCTYC